MQPFLSAHVSLCSEYTPFWSEYGSLLCEYLSEYGSLFSEYGFFLTYA